MKPSLSAATLSVLALTLGTPSAVQAETPLDFAPPIQTEPTSRSLPTTATGAGAIAVSFEPPPVNPVQEPPSRRVAESPPVQPPPTITATPPASADPPTASTADIFAQGSNSLVARAVGSAEGTRTPEGHKTPAYYGHSDPGNGVWNLGSFSYQHEASTPQQADEKQLARLAQQDQTLRQRAEQVGVPHYESDLVVRLNGIDLANQSPLAALATDGGGYVDRLKQAQDMGLQGSEAVLWARVRSFLDPDTGRWNAPGLGNTIERISHDQERRMDRVAQALEVYQAQTPSVALQPQAAQTRSPEVVADQLITQSPAPTPPSPPVSSSPQESIADRIIAHDLPQTHSETPVAQSIAPDTAPLGFDP